MRKTIVVSESLTVCLDTGVFGGMGRPRSIGFNTCKRVRIVSRVGADFRTVVHREYCFDLWSKELCLSFIWDPPVPKVKKKRPEAFQPYEFSADGKGKEMH